MFSSNNLDMDSDDGLDRTDDSSNGEDMKQASLLQHVIQVNLEHREGHHGEDSEKPMIPTTAESPETKDPMILDIMKNVRIGAEATEDATDPMILDIMKNVRIGAEATEDATILDRMRNVGIGVVTVGTTGTFAFLQISTRNMLNFLLKFIYCACNLCFGMSSLIAGLIVLVIYIRTSNSPSIIMMLKHALRLAILLAIMGYVLAVTFILQER